MNGSFRKRALQAAVSLALLGGLGAAHAAVNVQCGNPGDDTNGNAIPDSVESGGAAPTGPNGGTVKCMHLTAGDGFAEMSDGHPSYTFGFADKTGIAARGRDLRGHPRRALAGAHHRAGRGRRALSSRSRNVGTVMRADLFDPHTVHYHGFPNAATVFDGVPEVSISINMARP